MRSFTRWRPQPTTGAAKHTRTRATTVPASVPRTIGVSEAEWHALITVRPNLLIEGEPAATDHVLRALHPHLFEPLFCWRATTQLSLPQDHRGSLLLFGVTAMGAEEQGSIFEWLDRAQGQVQVVSMSARPLFPLVERGEFRIDLFYRLNVVRIHAKSVMARTQP